MSSSYGGISHYPTSAKVVAASNNIPTAFSTAAGSQMLTGLLSSKPKHLMILNETTTEISFVSQNSATPPSSGTSTRVYIPPNTYAVFDNFPVGDYLFIQSEGSAISSGTVEVGVW